MTFVRDGVLTRPAIRRPHPAARLFAPRCVLSSTMQMASSSLTTARARTVLAVFACAIGLAEYLWIAVNSSGFGVDFNQFYSASRLAGTGRLYDWDALRKIEAEHGPPVHTGRLPVVAFGVKLVGWMPYSTAHAVWVACGMVSFLVAAGEALTELEAATV